MKSELSRTQAEAAPPGVPPRWQWQVAPGARGFVADILSTSLVTPRANILKSNLARTVLAFPANVERPACIVKRYHVRGWSEALKYLALPSRAESEWLALNHFQREGIPAPYPLAFGERRVGGLLTEGALIMERIVDAEPLATWLRRFFGMKERRHELLEDLGRCVARMHSAGIEHRDLHAGNVLVLANAPRAHRLVMIDLHTCRLGGALPAARREANLAKLLHSLLASLDEADEEGTALLMAYRERARASSGASEEAGRAFRRLKEQALRLETTRLRSRTKRCWKTSSEFVRERRAGWRVHRRRDFPWSTLAPLLSDRPTFSTVLKDRPGQFVGVATVYLDGAPRAVVVKRRANRGLLDHVRARVWWWHSLDRAWWAGRALEVRRVPTPRTLALARPDLWRLGRDSILVTEHVPGAKSLREDLLSRFFPPQRGDRRELQRRVPELATIVRRLHDTGIYHSDLNPENFLVVPDAGAALPERVVKNGNASFFLVDLDSVQPYTRLTVRRRLKNLAQLGLIPEGHVRPRDRLRFLRIYDRREGRFWNRRTISVLDDLLARAVIDIIARISLKERLGAKDPEVSDPRFLAKGMKADGPR